MSKNNGNTKAKSWLITGASSGLGYTLAEYASRMVVERA